MKRKRLFYATCVAFLSFAITFAQQWNPRPGWKDSFEDPTTGLCWCDSSNYDHGLINKKVTINGKEWPIKDVCDELKKHPLYRSFQSGDIPYNDIQCGNGPANDAADEAGCPGRVDIGPEGCDQIGPKWDMPWLENREIFGGNGNGGGNEGPVTSFITPSNGATYSSPASIVVQVSATDSDGVQNVKLYINNSFIRQENVSTYDWNHNNQDAKLQNLAPGSYTLKAVSTDKNGNTTSKSITINVSGDGENGPTGNTTIKGESINKYLSSENGNRSMRANRSEAGTGENFIITDEGDGFVSIKGNNDKYVSSENGNSAMNCNRNAVGPWEKFKLEPLGDNVYAIKGNNGKYVSHENGADKGIFCNRDAIGSWERFVISNSSRLKESDEIRSDKDFINVSTYPNPIVSGNLNIAINRSFETLNANIDILDLNGKLIKTFTYRNLNDGVQTLSIENIDSFLTSGIYLLKISVDQEVFVRKLSVK